MDEGVRRHRERIAVLGAGRTGLATVRHLARQGTEVFLSDSGTLPTDVKLELDRQGIPWEEGGHSERVLTVDAIVPSPGIPATAGILQRAHACGISVVGELELAYRLCPSGRIVAVTGTVGKTTTTHLVSQLLTQRGHSVVTAGNIGTPFIEALEAIDEETIVVLEVSSFQLEHVETFRPHVGVLTRFSPHHLDRHGTPERYFQAKARLFRNQTDRDTAVVHPEAPALPGLKSRLQLISPHRVDGDWPLHHRENLSAALIAAQWIDPSVSLGDLDIGPALQLPHRLEPVAHVGGTRFVNDSKSTTPTATLAAIRAFPDTSLALVLSGRSQGEDLQELTDEIAKRPPEVVYLMGDARPRWMRTLRAIGCRRIRPIATFDQLVRSVRRIQPEVCLFSPGAASFDQFRSYVDRGEQFKAAVLAGVQTRVTPAGDQAGPTLERRSFRDVR